MQIAVDRTTFLGGSDIGAVVGVSRFKTPLDVYLEKTGQAPREVDPEKERIFKRGKRLEPVVLDMLADERGIVTIARNLRYTDEQHHFMACEVDAEAMVEGAHINLEVKTSHPFAGDQWGEEGTDQIDISYTAQALWGLGITGRPRCMFAVLIGSDDLCTYVIERDDQIIRDMRARALHFWDTHVLAGVPPEPINLPDVIKMFRRAPAGQVEATPEILAAVEELAQARQAKADAEDRETDLKFEIGKFMLGEATIRLETGGKIVPVGVAPGEHLLLSNGAPVLNVQLQSQQRLDSDRLKRERPEIVAEFQKQTSFIKFAKPRKRK